MPVIKTTGTEAIYFWCPGCKGSHRIIPSIWAWNGDVERPTLSPSVLVRSGHYVDGKHPCWCDYQAQHPGENPAFVCGICHSFVKDGQIQYLSDCTHALAGQTVPLPPWPQES